MTTTYGTIPTTTAATKQGEWWWLGPEFGTLRPWDKMLSLSLPENFQDMVLRMKTNVHYYHTNYGVIVLFVFFLSLLWSPGALIIFIILMGAWVFLYFIREDPMIILDCVVDDRWIFIFLMVATVVFILSRDAVTIMTGILVGMFAVLLHAVLSNIDNLPN